MEIIGDYAALPLKGWSLAEAFLRMTRLEQAQNVFVPLDLLILIRAVFLAEHTVRILDPNLFVWETVAVLSMGQSLLQNGLFQRHKVKNGAPLLVIGPPHSLESCKVSRTSRVSNSLLPILPK